MRPGLRMGPRAAFAARGRRTQANPQSDSRRHRPAPGGSQTLGFLPRNCSNRSSAFSNWITHLRLSMKRVSVIDSHTGGEPTRILVSGGPDLGNGSISDKLNILRAQHDCLRSAIVNEPRGSDVIVGACL